MKQILSQLDAMLSYHSRVIVIRIDLHPAFYVEDNRQISDFMKRMNTWLSQRYRLKRLGYVWVRETESSDKPHYHLAWMLDQHKIRHPHHIMNKAGELWDYITDGTHHKPKNCYHTVSRGQYDSSMGEAIQRLSYLAKDKGKGRIREGVKNFSTSRLKPKS